MLSLNTSKKLKDAGFHMLLGIGDWSFLDKNDVERVENLHGIEHDSRLWQNPAPLDSEDWERLYGEEPEPEYDCQLSLSIPCPRLDQLLAWVEGQGYEWELNMHDGSSNIEIWHKDTYFQDYSEPSFFTNTLLDKTTEEATAQAVLYILKSGVTDGKA